MGIRVTAIHFEQGLPVFSEIKQQYKAQTGLDISLVATVHLANGSLPDLMASPSCALQLLNADAAASEQLELAYDKQKARFLATQQYEAAAAARDAFTRARSAYTHLHDWTFVVSWSSSSVFEHFYAIEFTSTKDTIEVYQYSDQEYAVDSLLRVLVDLGGIYLGFASETPQSPPRRWRKLKRWEDYRWYNRPKK
ncbi:hypothetical protein [Hymenobacter cellulosilyticus]|uniref:Uncharacterized protein n=1 Tax=Hymenobacter cellulosilyticus TaxID=2932248 RepID=A0A8T9Q2R4_9BACT|nr:hypothetical protein [Hymenobacter cellulosilyticus]UOQ71747.1 hypothetical protein MUN79_24605 [Hymenobacter cellulosilyticus]